MGSGEGYTLTNLIVRTVHIIVRMIKSRRLRWAGHVARVEEFFRILTGKTTEKRSLGRHSHRWEDNIRMDLKEIGVNMMNWIDLAQDRDYWRALVNAALNLWVSLVMDFVSISLYINYKHGSNLIQLICQAHAAIARDPDSSAGPDKNIFSLNTTIINPNNKFSLLSC